MLTARKLALALQFARDEYANTREDGFFIDAGTVVTDETENMNGVVLRYENGETYLLTIEKIR